MKTKDSQCRSAAAFALRPALFAILVGLSFSLSVHLAARADAAEPGLAHAAALATDKTLAPYFHVKSAGGPGKANGESGSSHLDAMPLKSTDVDVQIAGVIADVKVTQVYANAGASPLEAIYVFPGSTRAAVYGMEMTIGERVLKAKVQPREEARRTYEEAKTAGKSTSLLEQQRPNVFQMNVANIMPGDTIKVELRYTELLLPEAGEYEFVFPTVVGPRYSNQPAATAPESDRWIANPYLRKGEKAPATFRLTVDVVAGMPLHGLHCATHAVKPEFRDPARAVVKLDGGDLLGNDRDFILKYRLADARIESGLLISQGEKENFFLLTVQPPRRIAPAALPPRDYVFIIDVSGSMRGFPLEVSKALLRQLLAALRPEDSFNVMLFSGGSTVLSPQPLPATAQHLASAIDVIDRQHGGGGTELLPALREALRLPNPREAARSIVVITDGYVGCEPEAFELIRGNLGRANLFAFGIGSSVNRHLIEGMARCGQGEPFILTNPAEAEAQAARFREYISAPVLTHIGVDFGKFGAYDVEPASVPDVLADRPVVLFGKWKGDAAGTITVRGKSGAGAYAQTFEVADAKKIEPGAALGHLWARHCIATLSDYLQLGKTDERVRAVTNLGMTYNLLTAFTSFVAVDEVVRNSGAGGNLQTVKQPLPLPKGVENSAVGEQIQTTPEPATWLLLAVAVVIMALKIRRRKGAPCATTA